MAALTQLAGSGPAPVATSSAPVLEYLCLFTQDLRRKQKRWQDGRLKFHTFNKRLMVYDERGNFVGDAHWREEYEFGEGDEVELERGNTIVQAGECVGSRTQDLSDLVDKRIQEKAQRQAAVAARQSRPAAPLGSHAPQAVLPQTRPVSVHMPLSSGLGTPTGHHGRARIPTESPFEGRQRLKAQHEQEDTPRPAKRPKRDASPPSKKGYAQNLFGAALNLSGCPVSSAPVRHRPKKVLQDCSSQFSSSDPSSQMNNDSGTRQKSPPAGLQPLARPAPLSEKHAVSENVPRSPPENTTKKSSKAKAAALRRRAQDEPEVIRYNFNAGIRPVPNNRTSDRPYQSLHPSFSTDAQMGHGRPGGQSFAANPEIEDCRGESAEEAPTSIDEVPEDLADSRRVSKEPLSHLLKKRREDGNKQKPSSRTSALIDQKKRPVTPNLLVRRNIQADASSAEFSSALESRSVLPAESDTPSGADAADAPRTELRVKSRRKRGLLMVSENESAKKARKPPKPNALRDFADLDHSFNSTTSDEVSQATEARLSPKSRKTRADRSANQQRSSLENQSLENLDSDSPYVGSDGADKNPALDVVARRGPTGNSGAARKRSLRQAPTDIVIPATVSRIPATRMTMDSDERQVDTSSDFIEEMELPNKTRKKLQTRVSRGSRLDPPIMSELEPADTVGQLEEPAGFNGQHVQSDSRLRRSERSSITRQSSERGQDLPPPRLAQLKKSLRSKEVIGFLSDDDDSFPWPSFQQNHGQEQNNLHGRLRGLFSGSDLQFPPRSETIIDHGPVKRTHSLEQGRKTNDTSYIARKEDTSERPHGMSNVIEKPKNDQDIGQRQQGETHSVERSAIQENANPQMAQGSSPLPSKATSDGGLDLAPGTAEPQAATSPPRKDDETNVLGPLEVTRPKSQRAISGPTICSGIAGTHQDNTVDKTREDYLARANSMPLQDSVTELPGDQAQETNLAVPGLDTKHTVANLPLVAKLVNPASRGRKAAKPSDAAGRVPERVLPSDGAPAALPRHTACPIAGEADRQGKEATNYPGFSKANGGGPWSREASDLFDFTRPGT